jgi:hypothetical protein
MDWRNGEINLGSHDEPCDQRDSRKVQPAWVCVGRSKTRSKPTDFSRAALAFVSTPCPNVTKKMHMIALSPTNPAQINSRMIVIYAPADSLFSKRMRRTLRDLWKRKWPPVKTEAVFRGCDSQWVRAAAEIDRRSDLPRRLCLRRNRCAKKVPANGSRVAPPSSSVCEFRIRCAGMSNG